MRQQELSRNKEAPVAVRRAEGQTQNKSTNHYNKSPIRSPYVGDCGNPANDNEIVGSVCGDTPHMEAKEHPDLDPFTSSESVGHFIKEQLDDLLGLRFCEVGFFVQGVYEI